jgi:hypothetical protein
MGVTGSVSAAELFHRLQTHDSIRMAPNLIPDLVVIHANSLGAALANLNVSDVTATQLLDAIKKEESKCPAIPDRNALVNRKCHALLLFSNTPYSRWPSEKPSTVSRRLFPSVQIYGHYEVY